MGFDHLPLQLQLSVAPFQQHPPMALEAEKLTWLILCYEKRKLYS